MVRRQCFQILWITRDRRDWPVIQNLLYFNEECSQGFFVYEAFSHHRMKDPSDRPYKSLPYAALVTGRGWVKFPLNSSPGQLQLNLLLIPHFKSVDDVQFSSSKISTVVTIDNTWGASSTNEAQNGIGKTVSGEVVN